MCIWQMYDIDMSVIFSCVTEQLQEIEEALIEYKKAHDLALVSGEYDRIY